MVDIHQVLQQQWQQAQAAAQQAIMSEQMGNLLWAGQCYENALACMEHAMGIARQYDLQVGDNRLFHYAFCHFNAARVKAAAGWRHETSPHLTQALQALQQAIVLNPHAGDYHAGIGAVFLAQENVRQAIPAFKQAVRLNPRDAWSHWILAAISMVQGNFLAAKQYYTTAARLQPHLPSPWQYMPQHAEAPKRPEHGVASLPRPRDWFALIVNGLKLVNNGFTLAHRLMEPEPECVG
ncbi:MAG: hypothetical protein AB7N91_25910 [Candidatus Tectimicrobiota bacterium]